MSSTQKCPKCGQWLPSGAPEGLCPGCLFERATETITAFTPAGTLPPNATVSRLRYFGDYELVEEIARGGMGVVYKAMQVSLNRPVAVKMILAGQFAGEAAVERFYTEAEAAANLQHPNIVAIHEVGEHEGQHYFSMDYVEGKSLAQLIHINAISHQQAAAYLKTIAEAIHYAHQRGTFHRDLKPSNILIDSADRPRVTDFGLAKIAQHDSHLTQTGALMGSVSYMPPEQAAGKHGEIGPPSDVYSLGAILYELLTGRPPFVGANLHETLLQVVQTDPVAPRKIHMEIPADLETICLKCLEKSPQRRYPSARALAEDLDRFLHHAPIEARPVSRLRRFEHWARQHPWTIAGAASLLVCILLGLTFGLWTQTRYLQWVAAHPEYVRRRGTLSDRASILFTLSSMSFIAMTVFYVYFRRAATGLEWKEMFNGRFKNVTYGAVSSKRVTACGLLGSFGLIMGVSELLTAIQVWVWEGNFSRLGTSYLPIWMGSTLLLAALRQHRIKLYGREDTGGRSAREPEDILPTTDTTRLLAVIACQSLIAGAMYFFLPFGLRNGSAVAFVLGWSLAIPLFTLRTKGYMGLLRIFALAIWCVGVNVARPLVARYFPGVNYFPALWVGVIAALILFLLARRKSAKSQPLPAAS